MPNAADRLHFLGTRNLVHWLQNHPRGQSVLHEATLAMCERCRWRPYVPRIVLVTYGDHVKVLSRRPVRIHWVEGWDCETGRQELEQLKYIWRNAPRKFREAFDADEVPIGYPCRRRTIDDELWRLWSLLFLDAVKRLEVPRREAQIAGPICP